MRRNAEMIRGWATGGQAAAGEDAVIAVAVDARRRNQARETVEELEGADADRRASVVSGPG
jgi:ribosomal protein L13E